MSPTMLDRLAMRPTRTNWFRLAAVLAIALGAAVAAGCDGDTGDASAPPWTPGGTVAPAATSKPRRTIEQRNPLGDTDVAANLMVDGDFELTGRQGQMPWQAFGSNSQDTLNYETGGHCRSGVRCAALPPGEQAIGWMSSPPSGPIRVSMWARPSAGLCKDFSVRVLDIDDGTGGTPIYATDDHADATGWCRFIGIAANLAHKAPVVYVTVGSKSGVVVLDDVVAEAAPDADAGVGVHLLAKNTRFTAAEAERFATTVQWIRAHRNYGRPPARPVEGPAPRFPLDR